MLVTVALLTAMEIVLEKFCGINTLGMKIGFGFVPVAVAAMLYGAIGGGIVGGVGDLIGSLLFPTGTYFPGFTVTAILCGVVWSLFLRHKDDKYPVRVLVPTLINNLIFGLCINTFFITLIAGKKTYFAWLVARLPEYAVMIPLTLVLVPVFERIVGTTVKQKN